MPVYKLSEVKVVKEFRKSYNISIKIVITIKHINNKIPILDTETIKDKIPSYPNITLSICNVNNDIIDKSTNILELDNSEKCKKDDILEIPSPIEYDKHYVSFIIMYHFNYGFRTTPYTNQCLVGNNFLIKKSNITPCYLIENFKDFKYKKFIREKMLKEFRYKNKSILAIKSIGVYKNFHNYIVLLKPTDKRHNCFKQLISTTSTDYVWRQLYDYYVPHKLGEYQKEIHSKTPDINSVYTHLTKTSKLDILFTDVHLENKIKIMDIYLTLIKII